MAVRRQYNLQGTNDFLIAAVVLLGLGIWAVKDGWFPSPRVLERHPRQVELRAPGDGTVLDVRVIPGQSVLSNQVVGVFQPSVAGGSTRQDNVELRSPALGTVVEVKVARLDEVKAGSVLMTFAPDDIFYLFNKSLAVLSLIGAVVCLVIHRAVR